MVYTSGPDTHFHGFIVHKKYLAVQANQLNLLGQKSDKYPIFPPNNILESHIEVMKMKEMITN